MSNESKQVIIVRKDLRVRKGKMMAQSAHASMAALLNKMYWIDDLSPAVKHPMDLSHPEEIGGFVLEVKPGEALWEWISGGFAKIVVGVESEEELLELYNKASEAGILASLITDSGRTEFHGEPTNTAVAIGPDWPERIDPITGHLKLL